MFWLVLHAGFMLTAVGLMLAGIKIAMSYRRRRWWLKVHKRIGLTGAAIMAVGFLLAAIMVSSFGGEHFDSAHPWLGILAFLSAVSTIALGMFLFHFRARAAAMRKTHRWLGRFAAVIAVINAFFGLIIAIV